MHPGGGRSRLDGCLSPRMWTSFHHQPEAQHPKSSAIHKLPADYPISAPTSDITREPHHVTRRPILPFSVMRDSPLTELR